MSSAKKRPLILVIEDDIAARKLYAEMLSQAGPRRRDPSRARVDRRNGRLSSRKFCYEELYE
jgi:CheY-like chemotaxis protein